MLVCCAVSESGQCDGSQFAGVLNQPPLVEHQSGSEKSRVPGYMSATECAQLKLALGKRSRLSPSLGTITSRTGPEHLRRDPGPERDQGRERER